MKIHHTKNKGDLGVLKAQVEMYEQGWLPLVPSTEHSPFDLVGYKDGQFRKIQVKYRRSKRGGSTVEVDFRSCWTDRNGTHTTPIDKSQIDLICVYCPCTDKCYWIDPVKFGKCVTLRLKPVRSTQVEKTYPAENYLKIK